MPFDLGLTVDTLAVKLHRDAAFNSILALDTAFPAGTNVRLVFTGTDPDQEWPATINAEGEAVWAVAPEVTNVRTHGEKVELWVGDECWATGTVTRRGA